MLSAIHWQYPQGLPWALLLMVAAGASLLWLYPTQLYHAPPVVRWTMPALRLLATGALILSILRPVMSRPRTEAERGPVIVLVDTSRSMSVVDAGRSPGQCVSIAAALGRLPTLSRDPEYQAVQRDCDRLLSLIDDIARARVERDYAKLSGGSVDSASARLDQKVLELRSTAHDAAGKAADFPRGAQLQRALAYLVGPLPGTEEEAWLDRIGDKARAAANESEQARIANDALLYASDVKVRDACTALQSMSRLRLGETLIDDESEGLFRRLKPDISGVLFAVGDQAFPVSLGERSIPQGLTNGKNSNLVGGVRAALATLHGAPARAVVLISDGRQVNAESLSALPNGTAPVFTIAAADREGFKDISVTDVIAPPSAFVGETVAVRCQIRATGFNGQSTAVSLVIGNDRQTRQVTFTDDRPIAVDFTGSVTTGGLQKLVIDVTGVAGEISLENNRVERWIKVFDRKFRVGMVGLSGKDGAIARSAVSRQPWAELSQDAMSPEQIGRLDVLVLGGDAGVLNAGQWAAAAKLLAVKGGSVVLTPGSNGSFGDSNQAISQLLPLIRPAETRWRTWPGAAPGFQISSIAGVRALDFGESGDALWRSLPPVSHYVPITPLKTGVRPLLVETESRTPVLTEERIGRGRVFCLGINETWRWAGNDREIPERFWQRLLRYAGGDPYEAHDGSVSLDADPVSTEPGQPVRFRARISAGSRDPASVKIRFVLSGKVVREQWLLPSVPIASGVFEAVMPGLPDGDYDVQADAGPSLGRPAVQLHVHPSFEAEMTDLSGDESWLRRLSQLTGGQFLRLDQVDQLPRRLRELPADLSHPAELPLWDSPYLFVLVLGCFTAEWGLRKRFGLA